MPLDPYLKNNYPAMLLLLWMVIEDGQKKKRLQIIDGHKKGSEVVKNIVKKSLELKIKYLTFFSFSTENWNRSKMKL